MNPTIRTYLLMVAAAVTPAVAASCGNVTVGGFSEATVSVTGDADTLSAAGVPVSPSAPVRSGPQGVDDIGEGPAGSAEEAEGEVQVEFLAYLVTESGAQVQLGDEEIQVRVDVRGRTELDAVDRQRIPARQYTEFRLIFTDIHAEVEGLVIGGEPVTEVHVELEDLSLLVTRPLALEARPGQAVDLLVDLNSLAWLEAVDPLTGAVDEAVFAELVNVVPR